MRDENQTDLGKSTNGVPMIPMASQEAQATRYMRIIKWLIISFMSVIVCLCIILFWSVFYYEETTVTTMEQISEGDAETNNFANQSGGDTSGTTDTNKDNQ